MFGDRVRDEAVACAKARQHPEVELRHVLWALVRVLGSEAPGDIDRQAVGALLEPPGSAATSPAIAAAAEAALQRVASRADAVTVAHELAATLLPPAGSPPTVSGTAASASAAVASQEQATESAREAAVDRQPVAAASGESVEAILSELDALVGLDAVKLAVRRLVATQRLNAERRHAGLPEVGAGNHIVFTGNPGTGKTTVARLIARLYGALHIVEKGHLVETSRADLVAGYVGQTAIKVEDVVLRAVGGVLFIDEAYSLAIGASADFGAEAIATLVKLMEDHRTDLAVIAAGYREPMVQFIDSNPGLRSRFTHYIDFPDYSPDELVRVFESMTAAARVRLSPDVPPAVRAIFTEAHRQPQFGNARYARSLFEHAYANMATRVLEDDRIEGDELDLLQPVDLPSSLDQIASQRHRIGFGEPNA